MIAAERLRRRLERREFLGLRRELSAAPARELETAWPRLAPLEKLALFRLLEAPAALELYRRLPFGERYFLFVGAPLGALAPVTEGLGHLERPLFRELPGGLRRRMYELLRP